jgi:anti-sigma B factor antagonist
MKSLTRCTAVSPPRPESTSVENTVRLGYAWSRPVLRFHGELDLATATTVRAALDQACREASGEVIVDLADVQFFDVVTLGIFAHAHDRLTETGGRLTLLGLTPYQEKVLRICALERLLGVAVCRTWGRPIAAGRERPPR